MSSLSIRGIAATILVLTATHGATARNTSTHPTNRRVPAIDPRGVDLLNAAAARLAHLQSFRARLDVDYFEWRGPDSARVHPYATQHMELEALRSGYLRVVIWEESFRPESHVAPTKTINLFRRDSMWSYREDSSVATVQPLYRTLGYALNPIFRGFFGISDDHVLEPEEWSPRRLHDLLLESVRYVGRETVDGKECDVVEWTTKHDYALPADTMSWTNRVYIGAADSIVYRIDQTGSKNQHTNRRVVSFEANPALSTTDFALPAGFKQERSWWLGEVSAVGLAVRDLPRAGHFLDGRRANIGDLVRGKRAVVLWPWAYT